jgi:hypothetical protein
MIPRRALSYYILPKQIVLRSLRTVIDKPRIKKRPMAQQGLESSSHSDKPSYENKPIGASPLTPITNLFIIQY